MAEGIAGIDHVIVGVRDLDAARAGWARLGFALSPRGRHIEQPTGNYCIMFPRDYVELLGPVEPGDSSLGLERFLAHREGLMAVAFAPAGSPETARAALVRRGLHPSEPQALRRRTETPGGAVEPRFTLLRLRGEETPGIDAFICAHLTPELMRRPEWLEHANGARGLAGIHILVAETAALLPAYDRLFGMPQVTTTDAVASIQIGPHRLLFSTPDDFLTMHPGVALGCAFPLPGIVALEFAVADRRQTIDHLRHAGIAFAETADRSLAVAAEAANGALLFFSEG